jgi:hypothetical protein
MKTIRKRLPSPAMLVACVALVVALGGVSYAAGVLPKNSVGTAQLKKKAVSAAKLKKNAVTARKVRNDAITSAKVKDRTLLAQDFKPGQLPAGPQGPKGDTGAQGPKGDKGDPGAPLGANSVGAAEVQDGSLGTAEFSTSIPAARVTRSSNQSVAHGTSTPLAFDTERYDTAAMHSTGANASRLTAPVNGIYSVTAQGRWLGSGTGTRALSLRKNGGTYIASTSDLLTSAFALSQEVTTQVALQAGDYVEAEAFQDSGSAVSVHKSDEYTPEFSMTWLAPGP